MSQRDFIIVSGLSGSGKTTVLQSLEDLGYYCVDNLPAPLLLDFSRQLQELDPTHLLAAVSIDVRNRNFLMAFPKALDELQARHGLRPRILFLEADEGSLLRRYSETRRRHPLTDEDAGSGSVGAVALRTVLNREREMVQQLAEVADRRLDTSSINAHELRIKVQAWSLVARNYGGLVLLLQSFAFKNGVPSDSDFVFDLRALPNPHYEPALRDLTGKDRAVQEYFLAMPEVEKACESLQDFLSTWLPSFARDHRNYVTVSIGCTGGRHRSVYMVEQLAGRLACPGQRTLVHHRELPWSHPKP